MDGHFKKNQSLKAVKKIEMWWIASASVVSFDAQCRWIYVAMVTVIDC